MQKQNLYATHPIIVISHNEPLDKNPGHRDRNVIIGEHAFDT